MNSAMFGNPSVQKRALLLRTRECRTHLTDQLLVHELIIGSTESNQRPAHSGQCQWPNEGPRHWSRKGKMIILARNLEVAQFVPGGGDTIVEDVMRRLYIERLFDFRVRRKE